MGTIVSISVLHLEESGGLEALDAAFAEIDRIERLMSTYDPSSEISILNREGSVEASSELLEVTRRAQEIHRISRGAFDVTIKPLLELYEQSFAASGQPPAPGEIEAARERLGTERIRLEGDRILLPDHTRLTLDGIAKGYAIDRAIEVLRAHGASGGLVNAGGDVRAMGEKDSGPWQVAMQNPRNPSDYLAVISLEDQAVATSGDYRRYFDPSMKHHHILDPRTGRSAGDLISVSVLADNAMDADALSTAIFVLGADEGMALAEATENVEVLLVTADRQIQKTSGWPES